MLIKLWWIEISKVISIKISPFCFLEAQDITTALHKLASDGVPFSFRIEPPHVPTQNFLLSDSIHCKPQVGGIIGLTDMHSSQTKSSKENKNKKTKHRSETSKHKS